MHSSSLNHQYRLVWNDATQTYVAVAETTKGQGKKSRSGRAGRVASALLAAGALSLAGAANLPTGGQVAVGAGSINQSGATLTVTQSTAKLVTDWQSFSIGQGNTVNFVQPSSSAIALNRVLGSDVSVIQGALRANGQVYLVNPNGVTFTRDAQVDTGGLVASTLKISNEDFMAGRYRFAGDSRQTVSNQGNINVKDGGAIALIAVKISNTGQLTAPNGQVLLGAGSQVVLDLGGPVKIQVEEGALNAVIEQGGGIRVDGGLAYLTAKAAGQLTTSVINQTGLVEANSLTSQGGRVILEADAITLGGQSVIQATGAQGGGAVLVGGDWQGRGGLRQAHQVDMASGARIDASATQQGDGGKVVLWSDTRNPNALTEVHGSIQARGGVSGGNGGQVETSGAQLNVSGIMVNAGAQRGQGGHWLLDPYNYVIDSSAAASIVSALDSSTSVTVDTSSNSGFGVGASNSTGSLSVSSAITQSSATAYGTLVLQGNAGNVSITAPITVNGPVEVYGHDVTIQGNITLNKVDASLLVKATNSIHQISNVDVSTNGGNITYWSDSDGSKVGEIWVGQHTAIGGETIQSHGGNITLGGGGDISTGFAAPAGDLYDATKPMAGVVLGGSTVDAGGGNIVISGSGGESIGGSHTSIRGVIISSATVKTSGAGTITVTGNGANTIAGYNPWGIVVESSVIESGSGVINLVGSGNVAAPTLSTGVRGIAIANSEIRSSQGDITLTDATPGTSSASYTGLYLYVSRIGRGSLASSTSNVLIRADELELVVANFLGAQGTLTAEPISASFHTPLNWNAIPDALVTNMTLGKVGNTQDINVIYDAYPGYGMPQSITGPISIYGGNINLRANLATSGVGGNIVLDASNQIQQFSPVSVTTQGGNITYTADGNGSLNTVSNLSAINAQGLIDAGGGNISLSTAPTGAHAEGSTTNHTLLGIATGTGAGGTTLRTSGTGTITLTADMSGVSNSIANVWGMDLRYSTFQTDSGAMTFNGIGGSATANSRGIVIDSSVAGNFLSNSGLITLIDKKPTNGVVGSIVYGGLYMRSNSTFGASTGNASTSNVLIQADAFYFDTPGSTFRTSGHVTLEPVGSSFTQAESTRNLAFLGGVSEFNFGKTTNTANLTVSSGMTIAGPINIYGGALTLTGAMTATNSVITLQALSGTSTQAGAFTAHDLLLKGTGAYDLTNPLNSVSTLAVASGVGNVAYTNAGELSIGTVGAVSGVHSNGTVSIKTMAGDLTLDQDVFGTDIVLGAGQTQLAGTPTGGDFVVPGEASVTSSTGHVRLFTGSIAGSTSLGGTKVYNADASSSSVASLVLGNYTIYREGLPIYLRLVPGTSVYGDPVNLTYQLYTLSTGGTAITDASPTGSVNWLGTVPTVTSNVGNYSLTYGSGITLANTGYSLSAGAPGIWGITPRPLTITSTSLSRYYGDANPTLAYLAATGTAGSGAGLVNTNTVTSVVNTLSATPNATASAGSSYTITPSNAVFGSGGAAGNYTISYVAGALTITKAPLTVTTNNATKVYGDANPVLSSITTGFKNGELFADIFGFASLTPTTTATNATGAGTAPITTSVSSLSAANYEFTTLVPGTLTITKAPLTVTANNATKVYGDANPTFSAIISGFKNSQTLASSGVTGAATLATTATPTTDVGTAAITTQVGTLSAANYDFTNLLDGVFTITKAPLTVTANNATKVYGDANPIFSAITTGFKNGNTFFDIFGSATLTPTTTATVLTGAGTAPITTQTGSLSSANYEFTRVNNGTLTITKAPLSVTANNASKLMGEANPVFTATIAGFRNGEILGNSGVEGEPSLRADGAGSGVGRATIHTGLGTLLAANYDFMPLVDGTLTLIPVVPSVIVTTVDGPVGGTADSGVNGQISPRINAAHAIQQVSSDTFEQAARKNINTGGLSYVEVAANRVSNPVAADTSTPASDNSTSPIYKLSEPNFGDAGHDLLGFMRVLVKTGGIKTPDQAGASLSPEIATPSNATTSNPISQ